MVEPESELTEAFMDEWTIIGIVCGVILGVIAVTVVLSLLICFVWRRKNETINEGKVKPRGKAGPNSGPRGRNPNSYGPPIENYTESYYVQPDEQHTLAPSAEMLHYQYQKERTSPPPLYSTPLPTQNQAKGGNDVLLEIPGLAPRQDTDTEVKNPLYEE
ncbi:hypothetical protein Aperf_G00000103550 [Anoplocephala perfoliata]